MNKNFEHTHPYGYECTNILKVSNSLVCVGVQKHVMANEIAKLGVLNFFYNHLEQTNCSMCNRV